MRDIDLIRLFRLPLDSVDFGSHGFEVMEIRIPLWRPLAFPEEEAGGSPYKA